jgi:hypothetical protein
MAQTAIANSTIAGVSSYPVIAAGLTAVLAIAGIVIPPFAIGALVVTQATDISVASAILSYVVVHYTPDSIAQNIVALAKFAPKVLAMIPKTYSAPSDFPNPPPATLIASNIHPASAAAIAVIQAHAVNPDFPEPVKS